MPDVIDKARKYIGIWTEDASRLKRLSQQTGRTQVELAHEALVELERKLTTKKGEKNAR
jgi:hypothetical protein